MLARIRTVRGTVVCAVLAVCGAVVAFGPLDPPAGPITPTYKTLVEVEPRVAVNATNTPGDNDATPSLFKITQPGSYYLTGNVTGVAGRHGIEIAANGVTLDLNGFDLAGVPGMGSFDGVSVFVSDVVNIAIFNGSVRDWGRNGVNFGLSFTDNCRADGLRVSGNAGLGISVGEASAVTNCSATLNGSFGIRVARNSTVSGCAALRNGNTGISTLGECAISGCASFSNTGDGFDGSSSAYSNCTANDNTGHGFDVSSGSTLIDCSAVINTGNGINAALGSRVHACTVSTNVGIGINVGNGSGVTDCVVHQNTLGGIKCAFHAIIRGNTCSDLGSTSSNGAGIHATGNDNRIEGNHSIGADIGIDVDGFDNIIIRNTCSNNGVNWSIAAGNALAPIVVATTNAAAVNGNSYAGNMGSTDPNANFTN